MAIAVLPRLATDLGLSRVEYGYMMVCLTLHRMVCHVVDYVWTCTVHHGSDSRKSR